VHDNASQKTSGLDKPTVISLDTFEDFTYTVTSATKTNDIWRNTVLVSAKNSRRRPRGQGRKADDKTRLDKEFKGKQKKLEEKLARKRV